MIEYECAIHKGQTLPCKHLDNNNIYYCAFSITYRAIDVLLLTVIFNVCIFKSLKKGHFSSFVFPTSEWKNNKIKKGTKRRQFECSELHWAEPARFELRRCTRLLIHRYEDKNSFRIRTQLLHSLVSLERMNPETMHYVPIMRATSCIYKKLHLALSYNHVTSVLTTATIDLGSHHLFFLPWCYSSPVPPLENT